MSPAGIARPVLRVHARRLVRDLGSSKPRPACRTSQRLAFDSRVCLPCSFRQLRYYSSDHQDQTTPPQASKDGGSSPSLSLLPNPKLPSTLESRRSDLSQRFSSFMDRAQTTLFAASRRINDLTGYSGIETLKSQISDLEASLSAAQSHLHAVRHTYKSKVSARSATQREVTTLLARQKTWTPADFERFTGLYKEDYDLEAEVAGSARELEEAERDAERLNRELNAGILARYHEEQIWSDKIRRMSTWGTWGLMGVNVLLFLVFQFGAEPWRRKRLVKGFEEKVREALDEERIREEEIHAKLVAAIETSKEEQQPPACEAVIEEPTPPDVQSRPSISWQEALTDPAWWKQAAIDLTSERQVAVRMRDVSLVALEGVVAGAALASTVVVLFMRRA